MVSENLVSANEKYAEAIGADYGPVSNEVQAAMLNGFTHSLKVACRSDVTTQVGYIVDNLTAEAKSVLRAFAAAIEFADE